MMYGGMRGIKGLVTETSVLDADEGTSNNINIPTSVHLYVHG